MKHTPGPWKMDRETGCIYGPDEEPIMVCGEHAFRYGEGTEEALANNYLFWAALDLLEVCKRIAPIVKVLEMLPFHRGAAPNSLADDLFKAIAKAEGQSGS